MLDKGPERPGIGLGFKPRQLFNAHGHWAMVVKCGLRLARTRKGYRFVYRPGEVLDSVIGYWIRMDWNSSVEFGWIWNWLKLWLLDLELDIDSEQSRMMRLDGMAW